MRTRKLLYPAEKVWLDKHKYDEAERLHYEREATLAASALGTCQEVVTVNGFYHDEPTEEELKRDLQRTGSEKKQKKRKSSPRAKPLTAKVDFVLAGLFAEHVWFDKHLFDQAETAYRKKLSDMLSQAAPEKLLAAKRSALVPWSEAEFPGVKPMGNVTSLQCAHGNLMACHHVIQDVWVNKFHFDNAEKGFVERSQLMVLPHLLDLPSAPLQVNKDSIGQTPDEGYVTALPTPSTPAIASQPMGLVAASFASPSLTDGSNQTVNGKPQISSLQALISEVWLEKPIYDDAERCFYANMFDGHPPGKVRLQERGRPDFSKRSRKDKKSRSIVKQMASKRGNYTSAIPQDPAHCYTSGSCTPPAWYFMDKDSELSWLSKPIYDSAEAQYYTSKALNLAESTKTSETTLAVPSQPPARVSSAPEPHIKKMAASFLMHDKIWFDKFKYDDAEKRYYEQINGPATSPSCHQENGASTILRDIARARENIQKSLAGSVSSSSSAGPAGDQSELVTRIASLEAENQSLRSVVTDLQLAISRLETRLSVLEKTSTSHHPSSMPPTQKVQPLATPSKKIELPSASAKKVESVAEDDDDIDLFGSDDEEEDQAAAQVREERLKQYAEKKSKKPGLIAKSSILLDVKPWDDETDMGKMEECVRSIQMDGLVWGGSKLVPVGYGIKKLQIQCVVEDDKVGTDILEEEITKFEDYVQSVDIAAFNKI